MRRHTLWSRLLGRSTFSTGQQFEATRGQRFRPPLRRLEGRIVPNGYLAIGSGPGAPPLVAIRVDIQDQLGGSAPNTSGQPAAPRSDGKTDFTSQIFQAYSPLVRTGINVATGNFDGDPGTPDSLV